jgi:hypothetical protein
MKLVVLLFVCIVFLSPLITRGQDDKIFKVSREDEHKIDVTFNGKPFTSFIFPDTLEKPVMYPVFAGNGREVTRGFPFNPRKDELTDHPHHIGIWLNFENVNGLDFWNNSYAIASEKKNAYGWIRTDSITKTESGKNGLIAYDAVWTNQQKEILLEENTTLIFSGSMHQRIIDRITTLRAVAEVTFKDAKDGMYAIRLAHELQIPENADKEYKDDKGNVSIVKGVKDNIASGNYLTSEGKTGNDAWSSRARWCKIYGKIGKDSVSVIIIDHPKNINYPTFWHARGYGLFAANPLGENIFTNGASKKNLQLRKNDSVTFRFRMVIDDGKQTPSIKEIDQLADEFATTE